MQVWSELTRTLDQLAAVNQQVREARSRERTARFYRLVNAHHFRESEDHVADAIELSGGWVILHWRDPHKPIRVYVSILDCRNDLASEGAFLMVLDDVSERTTLPSTRVSHVDTPLTPRERQVVRSLRRGLSNKEIAVELGIATSTARHAVEYIFQKLGPDIHTRLEAVILTQDWNLEGDTPADNEA